MTDLPSAASPDAPAPRPTTAEAVIDALSGVGPLPVFISTHGGDGRAEWFNQQWSRYTGQEAASAQEWGWFDAIPSDRRDAWRAAWQEAIAAGRAFNLAAPYRRHDGVVRNYHLRATPIPSRPEVPPSWLCVHVDAEVTSASLAAHTKAILDATVDAIITIDQRGIIRSINPAGEQMFGYSADEVLGRNVSMLMPEPYAREHDQYVQRYLQTGEARIIGIGREVLGLRRDGARFPIDLAVGEVDLGDEKLFTGLVRDLTERKEAERRIMQAERLSTIGQMVSTLAHESRNYLQRIHIALESAQLRASHDGTLAEILGDIERATDALNSLLDEVRNFAAPIHLAQREDDLSELWGEAWRMIAPQRVGRLCELCAPEGETDLTCNVDHFRLVQVFRNLFENSLAACPDPTVISIAVAPVVHNEKQAIEVVVADNGPGLTPEQQQRVFEPFYTTKARGTGLGMAIAHRVIEAHGGKIEVRPGKLGACFAITLPR